MTWKVPDMWKDGECWILGGGPSLLSEFDIPWESSNQVLSRKAEIDLYSPFLSPIHAKHVIGVNAAFKLGNWIDILFYGDNNFYKANRLQLANFPNIKITCNYRTTQVAFQENIKYCPYDQKRPFGISPQADKVSWNLNSGAAAISIAAHTGVKRIILVGFDMDLNEKGDQHWHGLYNKVNPKGVPFKRHLQGFSEIAKDAKAMGIEIINASPNSKITEFRKCKVKDLL